MSKASAARIAAPAHAPSVATLYALSVVLLLTAIAPWMPEDPTYGLLAPMGPLGTTNASLAQMPGVEVLPPPLTWLREADNLRCAPRVLITLTSSTFTRRKHSTFYIWSHLVPGCASAERAS